MSQMTKVESVAPDFFCNNGKGDIGHYVVVTINVISIVGKLQCYNITTMYASHYTLHITHYTQIMQGNSWAPRTSAHGVKRNPTERMKWMHWDKIFNRHECSSLTAFIFGSYLRSSQSVYGPVTHNSLTFDHEPEYLLCVGCMNYDWVL